MKKYIINTLAALGIIAGLAASVIAPWWVVLFICIPAIYAGAVALLKFNTDNIENYGC